MILNCSQCYVSELLISDITWRQFVYDVIGQSCWQCNLIWRRLRNVWLVRRDNMGKLMKWLMRQNRPLVPLFGHLWKMVVVNSFSIMDVLRMPGSLFGSSASLGVLTFVLFLLEMTSFLTSFSLWQWIDKWAFPVVLLRMYKGWYDHVSVDMMIG